MDIASIKLRGRRGRERTVDDLTTLFDLCLVVLDARQPSSYEPLLPVVERIDKVLSGADCTVGVLLVAADDDGDVEPALGPLARRVARLVDPDGQAATASPSCNRPSPTGWPPGRRRGADGPSTRWSADRPDRSRKAGSSAGSRRRPSSPSSSAAW